MHFVLPMEWFFSEKSIDGFYLPLNCFIDPYFLSTAALPTDRFPIG